MMGLGYHGITPPDKCALWNRLDWTYHDDLAIFETPR
jgi:hypothetical protein